MIYIKVVPEIKEQKQQFIELAFTQLLGMLKPFADSQRYVIDVTSDDGFNFMKGVSAALKQAAALADPSGKTKAKETGEELAPDFSAYNLNDIRTKIRLALNTKTGNKGPSFTLQGIPNSDVDPD